VVDRNLPLTIASLPKRALHLRALDYHSDCRDGQLSRAEIAAALADAGAPAAVERRTPWLRARFP
jgi:hypothetical protein